MSRTIKKGAVDQSIYLEVLDSTSSTGARKTGLAFNTASLTAYYTRNQASAVAITLATLAAANSAHSDGGFKEVDATNQPGLYRLDLPDAVVATGAESFVVTLKGAAGMAQVSSEVQLVDNVVKDAYDIVNSGAHGNAAIKTQAAAIEADTQDIQSRIPAALTGDGNMKADALRLGGTLQTGRDVGASVLLSSGTGTGQISLTSGAVTVGTNNDKTGYTASTVSDKTGYSLTSGERTAIANEVEAQIIDDTDSEKVLEAITDKIASVNPDLGGLTVSAIASAVWSSVARTLTAGTNIVLAKGTGLIGLNDLSAAQVNSEADAALADVGLTSTVTGRIDVGVSTRATPAQVNSEVDTAISDAALATAASLTTVASAVTAIGLKTTNLPSDPADQSLIIAATDAIISAIADKTGYRLSTAGVNDILRTALTEGYAAEGATMTLEQAVHMLVAMTFNREIAGTELTARGLDGATPVMTFTLNDATNPTSQVRAT